MWCDFINGMSFNRNVSYLMMFCKFRKQTPQSRSFGGIKTSEELFVVPISDLCQFGKIASPHGCQRQHLAPIVVGVDLAPNPALCLELVDNL